MKYKIFADRVRAAGLEPANPSVGHWQVRGGIYLVNFYPEGRKGPTIYAAGGGAGTRLGFGLTDDAILRAVIAAATKPPRTARRDDRKGGYRGRKRAMMLRDPHCHWCRAELTMAPEQVSDDLRLATLDHKIPLDAGGLDHHNNYVLACEQCNKARGNETGPPRQVAAGMEDRS